MSAPDEWDAAADDDCDNLSQHSSRSDHVDDFNRWLLYNRPVEDDNDSIHLSDRLVRSREGSYKSINSFKTDGSMSPVLDFSGGDHLPPVVLSRGPSPASSCGSVESDESGRAQDRTQQRSLKELRKRLREFISKRKRGDR